jgi:endonuclease YncB( thermonuclease family)
VVDGDTFAIGGRGVRLIGIDAPEGQRSGRPWRCGEEATAALRGMVRVTRRERPMMLPPGADVLIVVAAWCLWPWVAWSMARVRSRSVVGWMLAAALFGPITIAILVFLPSLDNPSRVCVDPEDPPAA